MKTLIVKSTLLLNFVICTSFAQGEFITIWNLSISGSGLTKIEFPVETSGIVNYSWETYPVNSQSGSGTFTGTNASITGLPFESTIKLKILPSNFNRIILENSSDSRRLIDITQWGSTLWTSMNAAFKNCSNLTGIATDSPNLSLVSDLSSMFYSSNFNNSSIGNWNISNVTNTGYMFYNSKFNQNIGNWNTSNVVNMSNMFGSQQWYFDGIFNQNISSWNVAKVNDMTYMFSKASSFN